MKPAERAKPTTRLAAMLAWARIPLLALLAAAALIGCGGNGESIPEDDAEVLLTRLDEVETAFEEENCDGARESAELLQQQVSDEAAASRLPRGVDSDVREALQAGATRLTQLVNDQCEEEPEEEEIEPVEPVEPPPPEPPVAPEPEEPEPPEEEPEESPGEGQGQQGGGQGGGGPQGGNSPSGGVRE